jgi:hypothetical protein
VTGVAMNRCCRKVAWAQIDRQLGLELWNEWRMSAYDHKDVPTAPVRFRSKADKGGF